MLVTHGEVGHKTEVDAWVDKDADIRGAAIKQTESHSTMAVNKQLTLRVNLTLAVGAVRHQGENGN